MNESHCSDLLSVAIINATPKATSEKGFLDYSSRSPSVTEGNQVKSSEKEGMDAEI